MRPNDTRGVLELEEKTQAKPLSRRLLMSALARGYVVVVFDDDDDHGVVGYAAYRAREADVELARVGVHPDYRRKGVGRALLSAIFNRLHLLDRDRLTVWVSQWEKETHLWLSACGFKAVGIRRIEPSQDTYRFEKLHDREGVACRDA